MIGPECQVEADGYCYPCGEVHGLPAQPGRSRGPVRHERNDENEPTASAADSSCNSFLSYRTTELDGWPVLHEAALHGKIGEFAREAAPHTEADEAGILAASLTLLGGLLAGRTT